MLSKFKVVLFVFMWLIVAEYEKGLYKYKNIKKVEEYHDKERSKKE
jgi:hypothetical protein